MSTGLTREEFRNWVRIVKDLNAAFGPGSVASRAWAEKIRPYDHVLADLYVKSAEAQEAIQNHILAPK
jgi:hypothetical protein